MTFLERYIVLLFINLELPIFFITFYYSVLNQWCVRIVVMDKIRFFMKLFIGYLINVKLKTYFFIPTSNHEIVS